MTTTESEMPREVSGKTDQHASARSETGAKEDTKRHSDDIAAILKNSGHRVHSYSNGIVLAVRLEAVPGTRSVHIEITHVVDLRSDKAWKTTTAMMAAVLAHVNRPLQGILDDVGLEESLSEKPLVMPWGRIRLPILLTQSGKASSIVIETRWVYAICKDIRPAADLSWLTDSKRVVSISDLALSRQSDMRSSSAKLRNGVGKNKVALVRQAMANGWYGVLALVTILVGLMTASMVGLGHPTAMIVPLLLAGVAGIATVKLLSTSRRRFNELVLALKTEHLHALEVGDSARTAKSAEKNRDLLRTVEDLSFVVSPLMVMAAEALKAGDVNHAVSSACYVLDECVRLSPSPANEIEPSLAGTDEGLKRFLGFMKYLGVNSEEESLAVAYVGLTGHLSSPIGFGEVVDHMTSLTNVLGDSGVLTQDAREKLDNVMNTWAMETVAHELEQILHGPDETVSVARSPETKAETQPDFDQPVTGGKHVDRNEEFRQASQSIRDNSSPTTDSLPSRKSEASATLRMQESLESPVASKSVESEDKDSAAQTRYVAKMDDPTKADTVVKTRGQEHSVRALVHKDAGGKATEEGQNDEDRDI